MLKSLVAFARRIISHLRRTPLGGDPFYTRDWIEKDWSKYGPKADIGEHSYGHPSLVYFGEDASLKIGKFCSFSSDVVIMLGGNHRTEWITTYPFPAIPAVWPSAQGIAGHPQSKGHVTIGNDVWIALGATILSGVTIGDGAVIGAKAVVAKDIPPYSIVVGNPARIVGKRFSDATIEALLQAKWWDWPDTLLAQKLDLLCSTKVDDLLSFVALHGAEIDKECH